MINLFLGAALLGFGIFYLVSLPKVPPSQRTMMTVVAAINTLGGVVVLTLVLLGIM